MHNLKISTLHRLQVACMNLCRTLLQNALTLIRFLYSFSKFKISKVEGWNF